MPTSHASRRLSLIGAACALSALAAGCSSVSNMLSNDKVDYRTSGAKTVNLEVPPDLSQLTGQGRYTHATGTVSANTYNQQVQNAGAAPGQAAVVAPAQVGDVTLKRDGQTRWLVVSNRTPEQLWPLVRDFWLENGFELPVDQPASGLLETSWSENRAKLPQGGLRRLTGKLLDNLYDTGERDQFRTRVERNAQGTEIYISHRGLQEIYTDARKEQTTWKARPSDPALEAEFLSRLMVKLGTPKEQAAQAAAEGGQAGGTGAPAAASAKVLSDGLTVALSGDFDQAWRRVGLALDRGGFTVEDRDRSNGVYEVRLASTDPRQGEKPGVFSRMFNWFGSKPADTLTRYRLKVASQGGASTVTVLTTDNKPADTANGREVARQLSLNLE